MSDKKITDIVSWAKDLGKIKSRAETAFKLAMYMAEKMVTQDSKEKNSPFQNKLAVIEQAEILIKARAKLNPQDPQGFLEEINCFVAAEKIIFANTIIRSAFK